ncbi:MAG: hypothetical protein WC770_07710 [Phycisphaerae bacterium]|jgi:hypothetical protein
MKTTLQKIAFYTLAILLGGCVPSLHPLFTDEEIIFDANLVGVWSEPNSKNFWEFKQAANKKYNVIYTDDKGIGKFDGCLGKIEKETYLDLYPQDINLPGSDFYKFHLLGIHTFAKVGLSKNSLKLSVMNPDNVEKLLKSDPNILKHEETDRIVLTASTKELQAFIKKYGSDKDLFKEENGNQLQRVKQQDVNSVK